ncbi:hypothetical protein GCM10007332_21610 [Epilithonimonas arachidiradicis]|uniref:Immunoglobulin domain-containing protein n=1 Tax=Epilithonimonas arachidiradicis TaxID=1617282 RepID=A0ABQ1X4H2_9FLAO|nr:hypothetical protein GCM10007332_21610 [Epilithonimonas arachidiradicis]
MIYFTDRGYYGGSSWQAANGSTEGAIEWHLGSDIVAAGTEVVIQGLSAKVNGAAKGTVSSVPGSNVSGLSLSQPSGDQIIIFQGGGGNPAAGTMVGGFHYNYCPNGYYASFTTDNGWDNIGSGSSCSQSPSSSNMPPGLTSESTFWIGFYKPTAPQQDIMSYTRGQFNGNGAPFTSLAALKAAIQNRNNWIATKATDLSTPINVPTGISYYTSCTAPTFTFQPSNGTICSGSNTGFTATASNATGYQWQVNTGAGFNNISDNATYSGATTTTLIITGATSAMNGYLYRVVATGACTPNATSTSASLTVNASPAITSQPGAATICSGANTTFTATASNATGYRWQVDQGAGFNNISNNATYSGSTTATLTITGATSAMNGYLYRVVATGACTPNATSTSASLTVNASPAITSQPGAATICAGANTTFTATASNATGYQWQVDQGAGFTNISNGGFYSGATTAILTITGATSAMNGYLYRVVATGVCTPNATSTSASLTVNASPAITSQPGAATICAGANTTFTATASNATGYQWQVDQGAGFNNISNNATYSGSTTATLTITGATSAMNGYLYRVVVSGACTPAVTSNAASLAISTTQAPTGASVQSFEAGDALNVLVVNGQNIKWYATENNAATHTDPLPSTTSIVNNTIYYATQTFNGCESSAALAIKAYNETLGANDIKKSVTINIYPNPAKEVLHFSGKDKINKIVILSIDGKKVSEKTMNSERKLNIHTLIQGTYLLNIFTDNGVQTIKFIKN